MKCKCNLSCSLQTYIKLSNREILRCKRSLNIPVAVSFKAELRLFGTYPDTSKQAPGESASTAASSPPATNHGKTWAFTQWISSVLLSRDTSLIWARRVAVAVFNGLQTTQSSCDEPVQSAARAVRGTFAPFWPHYTRAGFGKQRGQICNHEPRPAGP